MAIHYIGATPRAMTERHFNQTGAAFARAERAKDFRAQVGAVNAQTVALHYLLEERGHRR